MFVALKTGKTDRPPLSVALGLPLLLLERPGPDALELVVAELGHDGRGGDIGDGEHEVVDPEAGGAAEGAEAAQGGADEALGGGGDEGGLADLAHVAHDVACVGKKLFVE